jgi:predicted kinase
MPADLAALARVIASFHAGAESSPAIAAAATRDAVATRWEEGFAEIAPHLGALVPEPVEAEIEHLARRYLAGREPLFADRVERGRIVDGHGDLLAGDIFLLEDGPRVLDCLEFDDRLRYGDVLADVAFLAMDLERLGAASLASAFLAEYRRLTAEGHPASLEDHYIAFRAHIRAKVACLRGGPDAPREVAGLLDVARAHLGRARVTLTLVGGGPGTGKSTLAAALAARTGAVVLRSDEVRKDLAGIAHEVHATAALGAGIYGADATAATYTELLARARVLLERGESVVLDATWGGADRRVDARHLAADTVSDLVELRCEAPAEVVESRVAARSRAGSDPSDATVEVARAVAARFDAWPEADLIDTTGAIDPCVDRARRAAPREPGPGGSASDR